MTDVLLIGSSIFRDWGDGATRAFPGRSVVNAAVGGALSADWLPGSGSHGLRAKLVEHRPAVVACYVGSNDVANDIDPDATADNVLIIADAVTAAEAWFAYFSIIKCPAKHDRLDTIDAIHEKIAAGFVHRHKCSLVDINPVFDGRGDFFLDDGVHLTDQAYGELGAFMAKANVYEPIGPV